MTKTINMSNKANETVNSNISKELVEGLEMLLLPSRRTNETVAILDVPVKYFAIDREYQTFERTSREMSYLYNTWDEAKLLPVSGVPHDEEGKIYLFDGYGRWMVSQMKDRERKTAGLEPMYETLKCLVILNAPTEKDARQKYEAEQYAFQNKSVAQIKPIQVHGAKRLLGDKNVLVMDRAQEKYKFTYMKQTGMRSESVIGSYGRLYDIAKQHGDAGCNFVFDTLIAAGFNRKQNGYSSYMLRALKDTYKYYKDIADEASEFLGGYMRGDRPTNVKANAVAKYPKLGVELAVSLYLEDLLVDHLNANHKRTLDETGSRVVEVRVA